MAGLNHQACGVLDLASAARCPDGALLSKHSNQNEKPDLGQESDAHDRDRKEHVARRERVHECLAPSEAPGVNHSGETASSFFTPDALNIDVYGRTSGAQLGELTQKVHNLGINLTNKVDDVRSLASGQVLLASGTFSASYSKNPNMKPGETVTGNWMRVLVKEGSDWKILAQDLTRQAPPAPSK